MTTSDRKRHGDRRPVEERFWDRVQKSSGCWEWTGAVNTSGYGMIRPGGGRRQVLTHRLSWELAGGQPIPTGMFVLHTCDNRRCVRPDHLFLGTYSDNAKDAVTKGRMYPVWERWT